MPADLHCHTRLSDGSVEVEELIELARGSGLDAVAITDHDTFDGVERAQIRGSAVGVEVISGAEISCFDNNRHRLVHLLCYYCDKRSEFDDVFSSIAESRRSQGEEALEKIMRLYPITKEMVNKRSLGSTTLFKQHIMQTLLDCGYTDKIYGDLYYKLFNKKDGIAATHIEYPDVFEILERIQQSGGIAVLAHPSVYSSLELLPELAERGLDGVEFSFPRRQEGEDKILSEIAEKYKLIKTGGTDFHGGSTSRVYPIGTCTTEESQLLRLKELKYKRRT